MHQKLKLCCSSLHLLRTELEDVDWFNNLGSTISPNERAEIDLRTSLTRSALYCLQRCPLACSEMSVATKCVEPTNNVEVLDNSCLRRINLARFFNNDELVRHAVFNWSLLCWCKQNCTGSVTSPDVANGAKVRTTHSSSSSWSEEMARWTAKDWSGGVVMPKCQDLQCWNKT